MQKDIQQITSSEFPSLLKKITDPPKKLYIRGVLPPKDFIYLSVIGSRAHSAYGKNICEKLIMGLSGYKVAIVSGLALGIDSVAHRSAIEAGLPTIAFPGSGLNENVIYPSTHRELAKQILDTTGALISEFEPDFKATPYCFAQRNRLIAGASVATLVIEAAERSGALITARLASEYNRDIFAVPGQVFSKTSLGTNKLIKTGAALITSPDDLFKELGIKKSENKNKTAPALNEKEKLVYEILSEPKEKDAIFKELAMSTTEINVLLSAMELKGLIEEKMRKVYIK